ncbi:hypothetical protein B0H19DRAFT_1079619 [Mycena capillaripes]|nr:hypothetical protein B0H19DRAFT_1079619 [Mycena capillaripes]
MADSAGVQLNRGNTATYPWISGCAHMYRFVTGDKPLPGNTVGRTLFGAGVVALLVRVKLHQERAAPMWRLKDDRHSNINFLSFYTAAPPSSRDATHGRAQGQRRDPIPFVKHSERHKTTVTEIPGQPAVNRTSKVKFAKRGKIYVK